MTENLNRKLPCLPFLPKKPNSALEARADLRKEFISFWKEIMYLIF